MNSVKRWRPSPAFVVASLALFVASSGSAVALQGKNLIDHNDLRKHVVHSGKIHNGAVGRKKLAKVLRPRYAVVNHNALIERARGAVGVEKVGIANNVYAVTFDRNVRNCAHVATLTEITGGDDIGLVRANPSDTDPRDVIVVTRDHDGVGAPRSFQLQVVC
jgi:hypothetical protein